ncbi:unnamed protein product [Prunus armeniaca]
MVGQEDVGPVLAMGGLALDQLGASTWDNSRWLVQPGTLRGNVMEPVTTVGKQVMSGRIAHNVGRLAALARGAERLGSSRGKAVEDRVRHKVVLFRLQRAHHQAVECSPLFGDKW